MDRNHVSAGWTISFMGTVDCSKGGRPELLGVCVLSVCAHVYMWSVMFDSLQPFGLQPARFHCPWGFPRQEYWSGLPFPPSGDLSDTGIEPGASVSPAL